MEAKSVSSPPRGDHWQYEPKWDGFRCLAFRDGNSVYLQSRSGKPLARYFPDVGHSLEKLKPRRFVLDGEIVIPVSGRFSFDELLMRIHPAASRVKLLSEKHPAVYIVFDLLTDDKGQRLDTLTLQDRRPRLEAFAKKFLTASNTIRLSPVATDLKQAQRWFNAAGGDLDGIIAKRVDLPYRSGTRDGMQKIKHRRTADCVVGGFRYGHNGNGKNGRDKKGKLVGSLLLGLYNDQGKLDHVGFTSSFTAADRAPITARLKPLIVPTPGAFTGAAPGSPSRWSTRDSDDWQPLRPKLVVEIEYDHFTGGRFRHGTKLVRWRPDKEPRKCTIDQVVRGKGSSLALLAPRRPRTRT